MPRKYNKKSPYWEKRKEMPLKSALEVANASINYKREATAPTIEYEFGGQMEATAAYQDVYSPTIGQITPYKNISDGALPWEINNINGHTSISSAIILCQRAYANVAIFRNAIESAVEFSNSPIHFKTDNKTVREFFNSWANRVGLYAFKDQWFRERYRSGNNFTYRFMGRMEDSKFGQMKSVFGAKNPHIPIRYTILNPSQVYLTTGVVTNSTYVKMLSQYELLRLRNPSTPEDKMVFNSFDKQTQELIMSARANKNVFIPLDPKRLVCTFYKKQDYEPMSIPMGYPLLKDLDFKLELKKCDMSLLRTMEHVLLLVTTGEEAKEWGGGGVNPQNVQNLQNIFRNQTLGRVLVADYTTKAEWKIPDIGTILGPEKYIQVEKDIKEGLQAVFIGDDKFANATMKAKIYIERMKEGQNVFINEFLLPEIRMICDAMNFRDVPEIEFEQITLDDTSQRERVILRLAELGILTPDEVFTALETGVLPEIKTNLANQEEYKKARDKELYTPLIGGSKPAQQSGGEGRPAGSGVKKASNKVGQIGVTKANEVNEKIDANLLAKLSIKADHLKDQIGNIFKEKQKLTELPESLASLAGTVAKAIMANEPVDKWSSSVASYLKKPKEIDKTVASNIDNIAIEYDVDDWSAILFMKAQQKNK